jgi:vancomycin resistance protein YoaR
VTSTDLVTSIDPAASLDVVTATDITVDHETPANASAAGVIDTPRRRHRLRALLIVLLAGLALLEIAAGAGIAGLVAWDSSFDGRVLPGVRVGAVDLSDMTPVDAKQALAAAYPYGDGQVVLGMAGGDVAIPYASFGRRPDLDGMVNEAYLSGRGGDLRSRIEREIRQALDGSEIQPRMLLDEAALAAAVTAAVTPLATAPVDASVTMGPKGPVTTLGRHGRAVDAAPVVEAALAAVRPQDAPNKVVIPVATADVAPAIDDAAVQSAVARAGRVIGAVVVKYRTKSVKIPAAKVRSWVTFRTSDDGSIQLAVDPALIPKSLAKVKTAVAIKPLSATFLKTKSGKLFGVIPGKDGRRLDAETTSFRIAAELAAREGGSAPKAVKAAWEPVAPKLTTTEAKQSAPLMTKLGSWTTYFPISDHNYYGANIWIPARMINGTVLQPGQTFEWWRAVGPVSPARGFGPGGFIRGDHTDPTGALGGGMCSSSTTLFNAALRAGLRMGTRFNHKYYIPRYPLGLDATVWIIPGARATITFTNDMKHPILIRGIRTRSGNAGYVTYEIWGTPDGRKVSIGQPVVSNVVKATTSTETVSTLPHGVREQVEYPSNQMDVAVTRVVRNSSGKVIHQETWRTHYVLWNGLIQVGR